MISKLWNDLFADNPVIRESQRSFLKNIKPGSWPTNTLIGVLTVAAVYFSLIGLSLNAVQYIDASLFLYVALTVAILVSAVVLYGTLAGEREKRTLDLLLVAPITASQIIAGKMVRVVLPIFGVVFGITLPALVFGLVRNYQHLSPIDNGGVFGLTLVESVVLCLAVSMFVSGLSIFMSSINRTTAASLASTIAVLFLVYVVYSVMCQSIGTVNSGFGENMMRIHPYSALQDIIWKAPGKTQSPISFIVCSLLHAAAGIGLTILATNRIERQRMRVKKTHA